MSTQPTASASVTSDARCESKKLLSLLALAAGATALPQTSEADIIFTDLSASPAQVGSLSSSSYLIDTLPGTARLGFVAKTRATVVSYSKLVTAGQKAGYVRVKTNLSFVVPASAGNAWNQIAGASSVYGFVGVATYSGHFPGSYSNRYLAFKFKDSTQVGSPLRYGWVQISLSNPSNGGDPNVTIFGYAYDDTGAQIPMGAVPEPGSTALLALGALALGARGVRSWRRNRGN
jgi:hypothetical protein